MFLGCSERYNPEKHVLIDPEILHWCRRQTSDRDLQRKLFCYYARQHETFVIGMWTDGEKGRFVDVENMGFSLQNFDRTMAERLRKTLLAPMRADETLRILMSTQRDYERHATDEAAEQEKLLRRRLKRRGYKTDDY